MLGGYGASFVLAIFHYTGAEPPMAPLRRHLRSFVMLWLVCQVAAVSAFGPAGCCPAHLQTSDGMEDCQGDANGLCPMHASANADAAGDAASVKCPMHGAASDSGLPSPCVMRGLCDGPSVALSILFSVPGVLVQTLHVDGSTVSSVVRPESSLVLDIVAQHDTPPPRL